MENCAWTCQYGALAMEVGWICTIFELNGHCLVRAFHQEPTRDVSAWPHREEALTNGVQLCAVVGHGKYLT